MIHSLSGGVLDSGEVYSFAKVQTEHTVGWFLVPMLTEIKIGDRVVVPIGVSQEEGVVVKTEYATVQTAPVPLRRAKEIIAKAE